MAHTRLSIGDEALPGTGVELEAFLQGFLAIVHELAPKSRALLAERDRLQTVLDEWHHAHPSPVRDVHEYRTVHVQVTTAHVDLDIMYGPAAPQGTRIKLEVGYTAAQSRIEGAGHEQV